MTLRMLKFILNNESVNKKKLILLALFSVLSITISSVIVAVLIKYILNVIESSLTNMQIYIYLFSLLTTVFIFWILEIYFKNAFILEVVKIRFNLLRDIGSSATNVDFEKTESEKYLSILNKAKNNSSNNSIGVAGFLLTVHNIIISVAQIIAYCIILISLNILNVLIILLVLVFVTLLKMHLGKSVYKYELDINEMQCEKTYYIESIYDYKVAKDFRFFDFDKLILSKIQGIVKNISLKTKKENKKVFYYELFEMIIILTMSISILVFSLRSLYYESTSIGEFALYISIIPIIVKLVNDFSKQYMQLKNRAKDVELLKKVLEEVSVEKDGEKVDIDEIASIEFVDVSFKYPNSKNYSLQNVNLLLTKGNKYAIVGENGSGKTTMTKLMLALYYPTSGKILINGINIKTISKSSLYELFSCVFQDFYLYPFTLGENISMKESYEVELVRTSLANTMMDRVVDYRNVTVADYLLKHFSKTGVEFSGGESQRICISRALYNRRDVAILDEPNSSLDPKIEEGVIRKVLSYMDKSLLVMVTHRILTTKLCDKIIVVDKGEVVQFGKHEELIKQDGIYNKLYQDTLDMYEVGDKYA